MPYPNYSKSEIEVYKESHLEETFGMNDKQILKWMRDEEEALRLAKKQKREQEEAAKLQAEREREEAEVKKQEELKKAEREQEEATRQAEEARQRAERAKGWREKYGAQYSNLDAQRILNRLQERNLPIPQELPPIPENSDPSKFTHLVYIDPTVSLEQLISFITVDGKKLTNCLNIEKIEDTEETPDNPYFIWIQDGHLYMGKSPNQASALFTPNERGATVREGLFLILYHPEILKDHSIDLPGSRFNRDFVPCLYVWNGDLKLNACSVDFENSDFGSASVGVPLNP